MASSSIVIKVKFGETLRRFSASINDKKLVLDIVALREKIISLFNFNSDVVFTITYVDEDGDAVTLADDDDLHDVVRQSLNPLRLTVTLENSNPNVSSSTTSTPLRSPPQPPNLPFPPFPTAISEFLKSMPAHLHDQLTKLPLELASKASESSSPVISELAEKLTAAYLNQVSGSVAPSRAHTSAGGPSTGKVPVSVSESSNSKNKEKVSEGVNFKDVQLPKPMDLNVPYFDCEAFPEHVEGYNGKPSDTPAEKNEDTSDGVGTKKDSGSSSSGWAQGMLNATSQCPFSGVAMSNESYRFSSRGHGHGHGHHHWKRYGHGNGIGSLVFHRGVRCDGCGVHPITGPRYKSKVKEDYDLCSHCFEGMGNVSDYIRMDRPTNAVRHHMPFRGFHDPSVHIPTPGLPHGLRAPGSGRVSCRSKLDSRFILDVNVLDGTTMAPCTAFTKIWRMRNNGAVIWPRGSQLQWIGGDRLSNSVSVDIEMPSDGLGVEKELDIAVEFVAPELPGRYISYWRMASPSGQKFGQRVWVLIQVDTSMTDLGIGQTSINLNLPPPVNPPEAAVNHDDNISLAGNGKSLIKVIDDSQDTSTAAFNQQDDMNFPINDTLIIDNAAAAASPSSSASASTTMAPVAPPVFRSAELETALGISPTGSSSSKAPVVGPITYPEVVVVEASAAATATGTGTDTEEGGVDEEKEQAQEEQNLLEELEAMGFKQVQLNKEILRMNNFDLEKSVDDLCGVSEWDPMLDELQEMGFVDEEANRRLLKKNNGSIKRVVMDLINGEKA